MIIRPCLDSDATGIENPFREFVGYLRSIGDESEYRFGAPQYLIDGFSSDPVSWARDGRCRCGDRPEFLTH
jgi:hypothetical protein